MTTDTDNLVGELWWKGEAASEGRCCGAGQARIKQPQSHCVHVSDLELVLLLLLLDPSLCPKLCLPAGNEGNRERQGVSAGAGTTRSCIMNEPAATTGAHSLTSFGLSSLRGTMNPFPQPAHLSVRSSC